MSLNPGQTGMDIARDGICATSMYRNQWDKVNGAPNSAVFNVAAKLDRFMPGGIGISFYHDAIGFTRQNNVLLNYSYPIIIPETGVLGVGLGLGIQNFGMDPSWVPPQTMNDPTLPTGFGSTQLDVNFGLYFKGVQGYYVGISSTHLPASTFEADGAVNGSTNPITYNTARHYYIMGGYKQKQVITDGDIEGNFLIRTDMVKLSADLNARFIWKDAAYGGLTYRTSDAVAVMLGAYPGRLMQTGGALERLLVGYSYDITTNQLSNISKGSHEILLKYCYYLPPIPIQKSKHPRWL